MSTVWGVSVALALYFLWRKGIVHGFPSVIAAIAFFALLTALCAVIYIFPVSAATAHPGAWKYYNVGYSDAKAKLEGLLRSRQMLDSMTSESLAYPQPGTTGSKGSTGQAGLAPWTTDITTFRVHSDGQEIHLSRDWRARGDRCLVSISYSSEGDTELLKALEADIDAILGPAPQ